MTNNIAARKILLTSAGFETETIRSAFMEQVGKAPKDIKPKGLSHSARPPRK